VEFVVVVVVVVLTLVVGAAGVFKKSSVLVADIFPAASYAFTA